MPTQDVNTHDTTGSVITVSPLKQSEIHEVATLLREYFTNYREDFLRHLFENPDAVLHEKDGITARTFVLRAREKPVGNLCSVCREVFREQTPLTACIHGSVYIQEVARDYLALLVMAVLHQNGYDLHLANTANQNGEKITRVLRFHSGPKSCSQTTYRILSRKGFLTFAAKKIPILRSAPCFLRRGIACAVAIFWGLFSGQTDAKLPPPQTPLHPRRIDRITSEIFDPFWADLLAANRGFLTSRRTDVYRWTFQAGLDAGRNRMIGLFDEEDRLQGCAVLRKFDDGPLHRWMIVDWIAVGNSENVLSDLLREAVITTQKADGFLLEVIGFSDSVQPLIRRYLPRIRRNPSNSFLMKFNDRVQNRKAPEFANAGWFFGPYDGDRAWN